MESDEAKIKRLEAENAELRKRDGFLSCLEAAGVDNWDGYEEAQKMFNEPPAEAA